MKTVLSARKVITCDASDKAGTWVAFTDETIEAVGSGDPPAADRVLQSDGIVLPGLVDAHVHLVTTGIYRSGTDLRESRSVDDLLGRIETSVGTASGLWLIAGNFDPGRNADARMPSRWELDRVSGRNVLLVSRADGHSCSVNSSALEALQLQRSLAGFDVDDRGEATGILSNVANYEARARFFSRMPEEDLVSAQMEACRLALERGVTCVHEMGGSDPREIDLFTRSRDSYPIHVRPYFATFDMGAVVAAGLDCVGGDLFLDGSIGSRTAAFHESYSDHQESGSLHGGSGSLYHSDDDITSFWMESTRAGLQAGVHAIGDRAIEQAIACMEEAFLRLGPEGAVGGRRLGHRIEHFECVSEDQIVRARRLGIIASVQPMFDRYWGGEEGMYESRLGPRAATMNPFARMIEEGLVVAGGSDSTVTPLGPFLGMAAAVDHHRKEYAVTAGQALRMFTSWAALAGRDQTRGILTPGRRADLCLVDQDPLECSLEELASTEVLETWVGGERAWNSSGVGHES